MANGGPISPGDDGVARLRRHPRYWLDDGSLVVRTQDELFKVHRTLLQRHSPVLASLADNALKDDTARADGCPVVHLPPELGVDSADFEALLEHLYHDRCVPKVIHLDFCSPLSMESPVGPDASYDRIAAVLRASSKRQLDFPLLHQLARQRLESIVPSDPTAFYEVERPDDMLTLAVNYDIQSVSYIHVVRKPLPGLIADVDPESPLLYACHSREPSA